MPIGFLSLISIVALVVSSLQPLAAAGSVVSIPLVTLAPFPIQPAVSQVQVTPDRARVVYLRSGSPDQLWVTDLNQPLAGRRLLIDTTRDGGVGGYVLTPDSQSALVITYYYPPAGSLEVTLYRVPLDGGPKVALAPPNAFVPSSSTELHLTPDGSRAILSAVYGGGLRILSIPVSGGALTPLMDPIPSDGVLLDLQITADNSAVTYLRALTYGGQTELYSVPLGGGPATRLSPGLTAGGNVLFHRLAPDGSRDVFLADATVDGRIDLYSAPAGGGAATLLATAAANAGFSFEEAVRITPDSQRVVYSDATHHQLRSSALAGGSAATVNPPAPHVYAFEPTPDSQRVVFLSDQELGTTQLFSAPILGGATTRLNPELVLGTGQGCCLVLGYSPSGAEVVFLSQDSLYVAPVVGGPSRWLAAASSSSAGTVAPEGSFVYYVMTDALGENLIRRVPLSGGDPETVSGPLFMAHSYPFELAANSTRVVYFGPAGNFGFSLYLGFSGYSLLLPDLLRDSNSAP